MKNLLPHALENPLDFILAIVLNALNIAIDRLNIHLNFYIRCSNFHMFNVWNANCTSNCLSSLRDVLSQKSKHCSIDYAIKNSSTNKK